MLQSEAGYIDARPLTTISTKTLATHGRTIHSGHEQPIDGGLDKFAYPPIATVSLHCRK